MKNTIQKGNISIAPVNKFWNNQNCGSGFKYIFEIISYTLFNSITFLIFGLF